MCSCILTIMKLQVAARCVMNNQEDKEITMGNTGEDEMCNYYLMYWVWGDNTLRSADLGLLIVTL